MSVDLDEGWKIYYWPKSTPGWRTAVGRLELGGRVFGLKFVLDCVLVLGVRVRVRVGHNLALARHWSHTLSPLTGSPALH